VAVCFNRIGKRPTFIFLRIDMTFLQRSQFSKLNGLLVNPDLTMSHIRAVLFLPSDGSWLDVTHTIIIRALRSLHDFHPELVEVRATDGPRVKTKHNRDCASHRVSKYATEYMFEWRLTDLGISVRNELQSPSSSAISH